ncbi:MAG: hypothetical protein JWM60_1688 [Solirubrobacterales bacterium]|nr:hypothetical protein [Solirubrobacterales bacterium]
MFNENDRVRVPNPEGDGTVEAIVIVSATKKGELKTCWVRYLDGPQKGLPAKVAHDDIKRA